MKALLYASYGGPDVLRVAEVPEPSPGPGELLVRVRAASIGPGDCKLRAGLLQAHFSISFPKIPGRYGGGEVAALGADVDDIRIGDGVVFSRPLTTRTAVASSKSSARAGRSPTPPRTSRFPRRLPSFTKAYAP